MPLGNPAWYGRPVIPMPSTPGRAGELPSGMPTGEPANLEGLFDAGDGLPESLPLDPMPTLAAWLEEAWKRRDEPNPNAIALATVDVEGRPSARIVLCKSIVADPGYIVFYTNYESRKGRELAANPNAAAVFHWDHADLQARIVGPVVRSPAGESDAYYASRELAKRLGAHASDQSRPIGSRQEMIEKVGETVAGLGVDLDALAGAGDMQIPRPAHWGGFRLWAREVELWVGSGSRIHDRARWTRELTPEGEGFNAGAWSASRLQP